ncbi:WD repeat-containing protein 49 [Microbotryomycetes sp. JL201]|nr:WD repeat-containing protein 49 [Microbotryomycetes sp. JL201]
MSKTRQARPGTRHDTSNLFQTDAQFERARARTDKASTHARSGYPVALKSKPLRLVVRQRPGAQAHAWVAESGFVIRKLGLESGSTSQLYKGHLGPVTAIDFYQTGTSDSKGKKRQLLVSGSWDKTVRVWDTNTRKLLSTTVGHVDFVKAVHVIPHLGVVVSGSSDRDLRIWDLTRFDGRPWDDEAVLNDDVAGEEPEVLAEPSIGAAPPAAVANAPLDLLLVLKGHTRPIERIASYAIIKTRSSANADSDPEPTGRFALLSADSMGALKTWELWRDELGRVHGQLRSEARHHEIGIYDMVVGDGEIWTVSADTSALLSSFDSSSPTTPIKPLVRIPLPNGIKSVLPLSIALPALNSSHVLLGSSDELIYVIDASVPELDPSMRSTALPSWPASAPLTTTTHDQKVTGLVSTVQGHSHEITDLHVFMGPADLSDGTVDVDDGEKVLLTTKDVKRDTVWIVSASVDGTLRRWKWTDVLAGTTFRPVKDEQTATTDVNLLTAEEEAELEALMAED